MTRGTNVSPPAIWTVQKTVEDLTTSALPLPSITVPSTTNALVSDEGKFIPATNQMRDGIQWQRHEEGRTTSREGGSTITIQTKEETTDTAAAADTSLPSISTLITQSSSSLLTLERKQQQHLIKRELSRQSTRERKKTGILHVLPHLLKRDLARQSTRARKKSIRAHILSNLNHSHYYMPHDIRRMQQQAQRQNPTTTIDATSSKSWLGLTQKPRRRIRIRTKSISSSSECWDSDQEELTT